MPLTPGASSSSRVPASTSSNPTTRPSTKSAPKVNHNSLSSIVSQLVRSQYGDSASSVPDDQLDQHVAQMLLQDAQKKQQQWNERGSYLDREPDKNAPIRKPNKRFLSNMIKNVDEHNQALLRQERDAQRKREREEREAADEWRREFRKESKRAENDERYSERRHERRSDDGDQRRDDDVYRSRRDGGDREKNADHSSQSRHRKGRLSYDEEVDDDREARRRRRRHHESSRSERHRSSSPARRREEEHDSELGSSSSQRTRHRSQRDHEHDFDDDDDDRRDRRRRHRQEDEDERHDRGRSRTHQRHDAGETESVDDVLAQVELETNGNRARRTVDMPSTSPPPKPSSAPPSKMDKYFEADYDPRLDVNLDDVTQSNGIIADAGFDGWNSMLQIIRERKEEKKEREWKEKTERKREREKVRKEREHRRKRRRGESVSSSEGESDGGLRDKGKGLMDVEYVKRGSTREWDLGKESAT
ncbi:hypothetical protein ACM66B_002295 [Microbotryomycetes sp. NB124-2]